ncbi:DUF192 domain-containing protein [Winogradskyella sp. PE311]|uniref:DUF192 domain-containing protein n=1 Tax=Winogradskyella sp. PE311 TaxID=3366943 RepID=UPI00398000EB
MRLNNLSKYFTAIIVLLLALNCREKKLIKTEDKVTVSFKKEGVLNLKKADTDSIIKTLDIEIANNEYEIQTGLMYRNKLDRNHGMLFIFPDVKMRSFYMKNTKIPLDIIYIAEDKSIVSIQKNALPFDETSLPSEAPAKYVLEINAGLSDEWQLNIGDVIDYYTM